MTENLLDIPVQITKPILADLGNYQKELQEVWDSGWLTNNGYKHQKLEAKLQQEILRVPAVSLVANATFGMLSVLRQFELKGEVITTSFSFPATPHVISWAGLKPVFCDIDPISLTIDPLEIEKKITKSTSAILAVHVFGRPCHVDEIDRIAKKHGLKVIYDAAHAFELEIGDKSIASYGDASIFSFHATKLFHTAEGGAVVFQKPVCKKQFDVLKNFGIQNDEVVECGLNFKMNELQAALGLVVLEERERERQARKDLSGIYDAELSQVAGVRLVGKDPIVTKESLQYYAIRICEDEFGISRDAVWEHLKALNVFARRYFYPLCSDYSHYASQQRFPVASKVVNEVLCLPFHSGVTEEQASYICKAIRKMKRSTG